MSKRNGHSNGRSVSIVPIQAGTVGKNCGALVPLQPPALSPEVALLAAEVAKMRRQMESFSIRIDTDPITALDQKRDLLEKAREIADTMGFHLLRSFVAVLHEKHCPESDLR